VENLLSVATLSIFDSVSDARVTTYQFVTGVFGTGKEICLKNLRIKIRITSEKLTHKK
jgi:hypothetical protein